MARSLKIPFGVALVLTLGIKALTGAPSSNDRLPQFTVKNVLESQNFVVGKPEPNTDPSLIPAVRGDCTLRFADVSALGWQRDVLSTLRKPNETLYFVIGGRVFDQQPRWRTFAEYIARRLASYAGLIDGAAAPLLGVIAGQECRSDAVNWKPIAKIRG